MVLFLCLPEVENIYMGKYLHWIFVSDSEAHTHAFSLLTSACCQVRCTCNLVSGLQLEVCLFLTGCKTGNGFS